MNIQEKIVTDWLKEKYLPKMVENRFWGRSAICSPIIQNNPYIKTDETEKIKVDGVVFRYKATSGSANTKTYQVLYKILKH